MTRKYNAPAGESQHQPRFWIDGGDPRQLDLQEQFEQHESILGPTLDDGSDSSEWAEPCHICGRADLPLHTDYLCPDCHDAQNAPQSRQDDADDVLPADLAAEYRAAVLRLGWICGGDE